MSRQLQMINGLAAIAFGICSILSFFVWLGDTDWLMGHTYGSASAIIAAFWTASLGVIGHRRKFLGVAACSRSASGQTNLIR